jgi:hypothetical protein
MTLGDLYLLISMLPGLAAVVWVFVIRDPDDLHKDL